MTYKALFLQAITRPDGRIIRNMIKTTGLISLTVILLSILGGAIACKSSPPPIADEGAIRAYADPATETTLQGMSESDLAKYTEHGNAEFKAVVTQEMLNEAASQIGGQLGAYVSKEFLKSEEQDGYTIVHYKAKYENGEMGIRMVFDQDHFVVGQWFE
jgi:hypothetical protein